MKIFYNDVFLKELLYACLFKINKHEELHPNEIP